MSGQRIIESLKAAMAGDFARVTIDGQMWERRQSWQPLETMPREPGTRIRALVETELVMEEHDPACLAGGWKRCSTHDRIVGWQPHSDPSEDVA